MTGQNILIRMASPADLPSIGALYTASWLRTYPGLLPPEQLAAMSPARSTEHWRDYSLRSGHALWVAEAAGGAICAMLACRPDSREGDALLLDSLHVAPERQGTGLGRALIAQAARLALEGGYPRLTVEVVLGNRRAEDLYRRLGAQVLCDFRDPGDGALCRALVWTRPEDLIRAHGPVPVQTESKTEGR